MFPPPLVPEPCFLLRLQCHWHEFYPEGVFLGWWQSASTSFSSLLSSTTSPFRPNLHLGLGPLHASGSVLTSKSCGKIRHFKRVAHCSHASSAYIHPHPAFLLCFAVSSTLHMCSPRLHRHPHLQPSHRQGYALNCTHLLYRKHMGYKWELYIWLRCFGML